MMSGNDLENIEYNNEEEAEVAQILSLQMHMKGVNKIQEQLAEQRKFQSLTHCEECGAEIPEPRRKAVMGCRLCVGCQEMVERWNKQYST